MESKKLEALLMAVDLGSFTKAAEVMGYTQSGLAQRGHPRECVRQHGHALAAEHHPPLS